MAGGPSGKASLTSKQCSVVQMVQVEMGLWRKERGGGVVSAFGSGLVMVVLWLIVNIVIKQSWTSK